MKRLVIFSCEHGGNQVPKAYASLFSGGQPDLDSHLGYDPGALQLFTVLKDNLPSRHISSEVSRLLVELNRSTGHPRLFSKYSRGVSATDKIQILSEFYFPYRNELTGMIAKAVSGGNYVLHISVHSFTPELHGEVRNAGIGLLYNPARSNERQFCSQWKKSLRSLDPSMVVRFNYPYLGKADGLTTHLRKLFPPEAYSGIELEVNQGLLLPPAFENTSRLILQSLQTILP